MDFKDFSQLLINKFSFDPTEDQITAIHELSKFLTSKNDIGLFVGIDYKYSKKISLNSRISNSIIPIGSEDYNAVNAFNSTLKGKYNSVISFALHYNI